MYICVVCLSTTKKNFVLHIFIPSSPLNRRTIAMFWQTSRHSRMRLTGSDCRASDRPTPAAETAVVARRTRAATRRTATSSRPASSCRRDSRHHVPPPPPQKQRPRLARLNRRQRAISRHRGRRRKHSRSKVHLDIFLTSCC